MEVTGVAWHPADKNIVLTSSLDGSVRVWDLTGETTLGNLCSKHVLKIRYSLYSLYFLYSLYSLYSLSSLLPSSSIPSTPSTSCLGQIKTTKYLSNL